MMNEMIQAGSGWRGNFINRIVANSKFQRWAVQCPLTRRLACHEGVKLFDIVQGFVKSQTLFALVELDVFRLLRSGPMTSEQLGRKLHITTDRMQVLLQAGAAMGFLRRCRGSRFRLAQRGAMLLGVPGLEAIIRHHRAFYRDLEDPVALFREPKMRTELSEFWPYVLRNLSQSHLEMARSETARDANRDVDPQAASMYSDLMAQSQQLVALDTLEIISLKGVTKLLDIGGGTGTFLESAGVKYPDLDMILLDLPVVTAAASERFKANGMLDRVRLESGSFLESALPNDADAISLVRVLYDHSDHTVAFLLNKVFDALSPGGRLIISEPMGGGERPSATGDVYFALYTMTMQTGRTRSVHELRRMCRAAGFRKIRSPTPYRPYVTRVLTAQKPTK